MATTPEDKEMEALVLDLGATIRHGQRRAARVKKQSKWTPFALGPNPDEYDHRDGFVVNDGAYASDDDEDDNDDGEENEEEEAVPEDYETDQDEDLEHPDA